MRLPSLLFKPLAVFFLLLLLSRIGEGAEPLQTHRVRFKNEFDRIVESVSIGQVQFYQIQPGVTTDYQEIAPGPVHTSASLLGTGYTLLDGEVTFRYVLFANWTLTLTADRDFVLTEDKPQRRKPPPKRTVQMPLLRRGFNSFS